MGMPLKIIDTPLTGLSIVEAHGNRDERGSFTRLFCARELQSVLMGRHIVQINHSVTSRVGALRGMHFQYPPHSEMKMIRCLRGRVWDVAVDVRLGSPTFLHWYSIELAPEYGRMFVIPEGFAHGFQTLEPDSELLYLHTAYYQPSSEGGLRHDDPRLAINWPLPTRDISERDQSHPLLNDDFTGVAV